MLGKKAITCTLGLLLTGYTSNVGERIVDSFEDSKSSSHETLFKLSKRDSLDFFLNKQYDFNEDDLNKFNSWIDSTISVSKENKDYAIIVNKSEYKLFLYKDGLLQKSFPIDLGINPINDKQMQGDKSTPEGMYKISVKLPEGKSNFYKGMGINYPDEKDKEEFNEMIKSRKIPDTSKIGGSIAIHGEGTGTDNIKYKNNWTHGCMALSNKHIDEIFELVSPGTPVTIVRYSDKELR